MIKATPASAQNVVPLPENLSQFVPVRGTPWNVSAPLFGRLKSQSPDQPFKLCEVLNSDSEYNFILKYFEHQKPAGYGIKRIMCVHNPDHTGLFEFGLKNIEREASNPFFAPKGKEEEPKADRVRVISRWEKQVAQFSPVEIKSSSSRQPDTCSRAKILPLWHGSSPEVCQSVWSSGFTYFGKQHFFEESASKGNTKSTDKGYFGSGIYFTNSAEYAFKYSSQGCLILAWVSMREPYPVVNDKPHPEKGSDMKKLEGQKHYQNYNAHYIPVASIEPNNLQGIQYYPCYKDQQPTCDEFVVFEKSQTLPRFWVELEVDFPNVVLSELTTAGEFLTLLFNLLDKQEIQNHPELSKMLQAKVQELLELSEMALLNPENQKLLKLVKRLMPQGQGISSSVMSLLFKSVPVNPAPIVLSSSNSLSPLQENPSLQKPPTLSVASLAPALSSIPVRSTLPAIAFGAAEWKKYIGDVGVEPALPPDIDSTLVAPCPFWPDKKVSETHVLTLIPQTVNGKPLNLKFLEELVQKPLRGSATKYRFNALEYTYFGAQKYTDPPVPKSHWALITRDVIEGSLEKSYSDQQALITRYSQQAKILYEVPTVLDTAVCIFMEYIRTGKRLYKYSYTWCQDKHPSEGQLVIGSSYADSSIGTEAYPDFIKHSGVGGLRRF